MMIAWVDIPYWQAAFIALVGAIGCLFGTWLYDVIQKVLKR